MYVLDFIVRVLIIPAIILMFILKFVPEMIRDVKDYMKLFEIIKRKPVTQVSLKNNMNYSHLSISARKSIVNNL